MTQGEAATRYGWNIDVYATTGNHYHILPETIAPILSRAGRQTGIYQK